MSGLDWIAWVFWASLLLLIIGLLDAACLTLWWLIDRRRARARCACGRYRVGAGVSRWHPSDATMHARRLCCPVREVIR